jgi:hypothetical protein
MTTTKPHLFAQLRNAPRRCSRKKAITRILSGEPKGRWIDEIMRVTGDDHATTFILICEMEQAGELDKFKR